VCLLDTGIGSRNMGDHIIVDSIKRHLRTLFPAAIFVNVPTHEYLGPESLKLLDSSSVRLVCGTNLLASHMDEYKQWKLGGLEFAALRDVTLLGCGWWQYQEMPNRYTELLLNRILSSSTIHSVRDGYSVDKLSGLVGKQVVNTTCPTLWSLTPDHLANVPDRMARDVVTTLTDYKADPVADAFMLEHLGSRYRHVYVWIQGTGDFSYLKRLCARAPGSVRVVPATLEAYDELLASGLDLDYVGTRLHAGVRALQKGRRALILAVDNRAREISGDTGLPCLPRERATSELEGLVERFSARDIRLPVKNINRWLDQFR
jgi:polysaccharide pyruvyl transferase WcaK-like protein